ncbi:acyl carrier protein [Longispora urticae]
MASSEHVHAVVCGAWRTHLGGAVDTASNFLAVGGDSMRAIWIMEEVESALGIEFPLETLLTGVLGEVVSECESRYAAAAG